SCVEKILHDDQLTSAPSSRSVSMSTAVCMVMWRQPAMRAPASGFEGPYFSRRAMSPGISASANSISLRPHSARLMSLTLYCNFSFVANDMCVYFYEKSFAKVTAFRLFINGSGRVLLQTNPAPGGFGGAIKNVPVV